MLLQKWVLPTPKLQRHLSCRQQVIVRRQSDVSQKAWLGPDKASNSNDAKAVVRLNKHLADLGISSRRGAEALILAGKVTVNGIVVTELSTKVDPGKDVVSVDSTAPQGPPGYILNKPEGFVTTKAEGEGPNILQLLPPDAQGMSYAGRLDKDSRGLVLLLADGRCACMLSCMLRAVWQNV